MSSNQTDRPFDIILVGVGGQGVLTIADLIAQAAGEAGLPVNYYPSKGMAQRGGFVKAQVRLGREGAGPNISARGADLAIALERSEALKAVPYIRHGGDFVLYDDVWAPTAVMLGKAGYPTTEQVTGQVLAAGARLYHLTPAQLPLFEARPVSDNVFVLGVVVAQTALRDWFDPQSVAGLLRSRWPKAAAANLFGFESGMAALVGAP